MRVRIVAGSDRDRRNETIGGEPLHFYRNRFRVTVSTKLTSCRYVVYAIIVPINNGTVYRSERNLFFVAEMGSKIEYVDSSQLYATNYVRNAKAVGVLWGIFTVCYAIIVAVAFITPEWIGDTTTSENPARFGLWNSCYFGNGVSSAVEDCQGKLDDLTSIPSTAIRVAAMFGGVSVCIALVIVLMLLLFFCFQSTTVYLICGWLHIFSGMYTIIVQL